jgi:chromosome partitioning protein
MKTISIINYKGGVGKTTSASNIAGYLACIKKYKVLCIDLDAQANLSLSFGISEARKKVIGSVITGAYDFKEVLVETTTCGIGLAPASLEHDQNLRYLQTMIDADKALRRVMDEQVAGLGYDYCIIDCAPSLNQFTVNALAASDYFLVPVDAEYFATMGLTELLRKVREIQKLLHPGLQALGAFITRNNRAERRNIVKEIKATLDAQSTIHMLASDIRTDVKLVEAPTRGLSIFDYAPNSRGAEDYQALTEEILTIINQ